MSIKPFRQLSSVLLSVVLSACSASPSGPSGVGFFSAPVPTVYMGTIQDTLSGTGTLRVTETLVQGLASGTWNMTFSGVAAPTFYVSGPLNGSAYTAIVSQGSGDQQFGCALQLSASLTPGRLTGTYLVSRSKLCPDESGTIDLTKQ